MANYISSFHQFKGVRNFRIPLYGNFLSLGEYVMSFTKYKTLYSLNHSRIKKQSSFMEKKYIAFSLKYIKWIISLFKLKFIYEKNYLRYGCLFSEEFIINVLKLTI